MPKLNFFGWLADRPRGLTSVAAGLAGTALILAPIGARAVPGEHLLAADVALARGEFPQAVQQLETLLRARFDARLADRAARLAFDNAQPRALERVATDWLKHEPQAEAARRFRAIARLELDDVPGAAADIKVLVDTAYETPAAAFAGLQEPLAGVDSGGAAARAVALLLPSYPKVAEAYVAHAELSLRALNSAAALASSERALEIKPGDREALWIRARARVLRRDCAQGVGEAAGLAAEGSPRDRLLYAWLASSCGQSGDVDGVLHDLARQPALKSEALGLLANNALEADRLDEAEARYRDVLASGRGSEDASYGLAVITERRGNVQQAQQLYAGITAGSRAVPAQSALYRLLLRSGQAEIGARVYDQFIQATPDRVSAVAARAEVLAAGGRAPDAVVVTSRARRVYPDSAELGLAEAAALDRAGRVDEALVLLRALRAQRAHDPEVANSLGYTLADRDRELPYAEQLIREALADRPDSPAIQDSLGWVLHRQGHDQDAVPWLSRAYAANRESEVAVHLGEALWGIGDHPGAEQTWRTRLAQDKDSAMLRETLRRHGLADPPPVPATSAP